MSDEQKKSYKNNSVSFPLGAIFFNHKRASEGNHLQLSVWDERIVFDFMIPFVPGEERRENKAYINQELGQMFYSLLQSVVAERHRCWLEKTPYRAFEYALDNVFIDKEGLVRPIGTLYIRSIEVQEENGPVNRVQIAYQGGRGENGKTTLGSISMPVSLAKLPEGSPSVFERIDPFDVPLYRLLQTLKNYFESGIFLYSALNRLIAVLTGGGGNRQEEPRQVSSGRGNYNQKALPDRGSDNRVVRHQADEEDVKLTFF